MNDVHNKILETISNGENDTTLFIQSASKPDQLAKEIVAFSNHEGGTLYFGVSKKGAINGLDDDAIDSILRLLEITTFENVRPVILPFTEKISIDGKNLLLAHIAPGREKPYCTSSGQFIIKQGTGKRNLHKDELSDLFIEAGRMRADEKICMDASVDDLDVSLFKKFYKKKYGEPFTEKHIPIQLLQNMNLAYGNGINLSAILMFGNNTTEFFPMNQIVAISFFGNDASQFVYKDSENIEGNNYILFEKGIDFIKRNLNPSEKNDNELEIPEAIIQEILVNALVHRSYHIDYLISGNIRISIYDDRIELENPGALVYPHSIEDIKEGITYSRNKTISSIASTLMPFRGIGKGLPLILSHYPDVELYNDLEGEQFKIVIKRI